MDRVTSLRDVKEIPFIIVSDGKIIELSKSFVDMTQFKIEDFINKDISDVFKILRVGPDASYKNIDDTVDYFLFTKSLEVRFVNIQVISILKESIYFFLEKPNSRFDIKFPLANKLCLDDYYGTSMYSIPDTTLLNANDKYMSFFDEPYNKRENCIGKHAYEFVTGLTESKCKDIWRTIIKTGKSYNIDMYKYEGFNRGDTYWKFSMIPIHDDNKIKYCFVMATEITEEVLRTREIEEQAKIINQQNKQLEAIIDNISEEIYIVDKDRNCLKLNKALKKKYSSFEFSNSKEYLERVKLYDLVGNKIDFDSTHIARLTKGESIKDEMIIIYDPNKRYLCVNAKPILDNEGNFSAGIMLIQDITTRVLQDQKIKHQYKELNAIVDSMSDGLELVNDKTKIAFLNQSAKEFFYNPVAKINAGDCLKYNKYYYGIDGDEIPREDLPAFRVLNKGSFQNYILTIDRPDKKIYASVNGSAVKSDNDIVREAILSIRDITQQILKDKAIEYHQKAIIRSEKEKSEALEKAIEMKDEFLSVISHEFKTPLNVINTAIQALNCLCGNELSDKAKKYISIIRQNMFRQLRLVNNLLDITRADAGRIKIHKRNIDMVFLTNSIVESVQTYSSQKGVTVFFKTSIKNKIIAMDDEKYERILLNLLSNAIKFTPTGKIIVVKLCIVKDNICIEVKDNGIGIPKDKADVIFERFGQVDSSLSRQAEGTGIGLSLVKKLVDVLDGSISVKSKEGEGSTFTILLPDETVSKEDDICSTADLLDNRLVQVTTVEFSDIYL